MQHGNVALKGEQIGKAIAIIGGLRESLNHKQGGEVAGNLDSLYAFMQQRLSQANLRNEVALLDEVTELLREVKSGWDGIRQS